MVMVVDIINSNIPLPLPMTVVVAVVVGVERVKDSRRGTTDTSHPPLHLRWVDKGKVQGHHHHQEEEEGVVVAVVAVPPSPPPSSRDRGTVEARGRGQHRYTDRRAMLIPAVTLVLPLLVVVEGVEGEGVGVAVGCHWVWWVCRV